MNTLLFITATLLAVAYARVPCHPLLCKWQKNGATFRISDEHPGQFVQCSNNIAYCFDCPAHLVFDNHLNVCVYPHDTVKPIKHLDCNKWLCDHKKHGDLFQFPHRPTYYVQCSHGNPECRKCPANLIFMNDIRVCGYPTW